MVYRADCIPMGRRGSVLIFTLWVMSVLTVFTLYVGAIVREKIRVVQQLDVRDTLHYIAESGVYEAVFQVKLERLLSGYDALNESWSNNPVVFKDIRIGRGSFSVSYTYFDEGQEYIRYGLIDEGRKININKEDVKIIARLFQEVADLDENRALELAYCIVDWRDEDSFLQHTRYGAEDRDYQGGSTPYQAKDAPFEVLEELLLVKGMTVEVFDKVTDYITIFGSGKINVNTAQPEILRAIGLDKSLVKKLIAYRKGEDLLEGTDDDNVFIDTTSLVAKLSQLQDLTDGEVAQMSNFVAQKRFVTESNNFMVKSVARLDNTDQECVITAVIDKNLKVKYWRQRYK